MIARGAFVHSDGDSSMLDAAKVTTAVAQFAVEIGGKRHSEHVHFVDAIKQGLLLRGEHSHSKIKVRDLSQDTSDQTRSDTAA